MQGESIQDSCNTSNDVRCRDLGSEENTTEEVGCGRNEDVNTLSAKDGDLRLSASNACLPKTEISVFLTECMFFTYTCYKLHMFTLYDVLY